MTKERFIKVWTPIHSAEGYLVGKKQTLLTPFRTPPAFTEAVREILPGGSLYQEFRLKGRRRFTPPVGLAEDIGKGY